MAYGSEGLSASDVALLSGRNTSSGFGDGFGGDGAWFIILLLIFANGGWGRNGGFGGFGGGSGIGENYVLATDFATIERKLDGVNSGICDATFALNNNLTTGFAGVQQTLCQGFSGVNSTIVTNGYETRNAITDLGYALQKCCCETQRSIDGVNYNMAMNTNALQQTLCMNTRDIIESQNANYRALHDEIVANRIEDKNAQIMAQQNEINALRLSASQAKQNEYLISRLGTKCPEPAYIVPNPNCCYDYTVTRNTGCGCC